MLGIYERVSSNRQDHASQHAELSKWVDGKDAAWFRDTWTGRTMDRPGWNKLWQRCVTGEIQTIVIWRLDRLGRTARGLLTLRDDLLAYKINLVSLRDAMDLSTPGGRMMFSIIASVAEYELEIRHERIVAGIQAAKAAGTYVNRGRPTGTQNKDTKERLNVVQTLLQSNTPIKEIARATGLSRMTIYRIKENQQ